MGAGVTEGYEDYKGTFSATQNSTVNQDIRPTSGEVWLITIFAKITNNGSAGDDMYMYLYDGSVTHLVDSDIDSSTGQVLLKSAMLSNNAYARIQIQTDGTLTTRTVTYWYQAVKLS